VADAVIEATMGGAPAPLPTTPRFGRLFGELNGASRGSPPRTLEGSIMARVVVKSNHLTWEGKPYFCGGADEVLLGSYGEKKTPLTRQNYLEVQGTIPASKLKVRLADVCTIDFANSDKFSVSHSGVAEGIIDGVPVKASISGNVSVDFGATGHLRLVKLIVENEAMERAIEDAPTVLDRLRSYGNDARICHQVFVVMEASLAEALDVSGSLTLAGSAGIEGLKISGTQTVSGGKTRNTTVTMAKGSTFAYLLLKIDWNHSGFKKTDIDKLTDDTWSLG
jgi:hypothetical protein